MIKSTVFVDTGVWYAMADKSDQFHKKAIKHTKELIAKKITFITTNLVIHETIMLLSRRLSKKAAITFLDMIYSENHVEIIENDGIIEQKAYKIFKKYTDQDFSITDCISFVVMKENRIKNAFTFDKHFKTINFTVIP